MTVHHLMYYVSFAVIGLTIPKLSFLRFAVVVAALATAATALSNM